MKNQEKLLLQQQQLQKQTSFKIKTEFNQNSQKKIIFKTLPDLTLMNVIKFLTISDIARLKYTSKSLYYALNHIDSIYFLACFKKYLPDDLFFYCQYGENEEMTLQLKEKYQNISQYYIDNKGNTWYQLLSEGYLIQQKWLNLLQYYQIFEETNEEVDPKIFVKELYEAFRQPPLPSIKLRRENVGEHAKTWYQNLLVDILYDVGQVKFKYNPKGTQLLDKIMKIKKDQIQSPMPEQIKFLQMKLRWYLSLAEQEEKTLRSISQIDLKQQKLQFMQKQQQNKVSKGQQKNNFFQQNLHHNNNELRCSSSSSSFHSSDLDILPSQQLSKNKQKQKRPSHADDLLQQKDMPVAQKSFSQLLQENSLEDNIQKKTSYPFKPNSGQKPFEPIIQSNALNMLPDSEWQLLMLRVYSLLSETTLHHIKIVEQVLLQQMTCYDFLFEYQLRFNIFVGTIIQIEGYFVEFVNFTNKIYEDNFVNYPAFPKFSIWRVMIKMWKKIIYDQFEHRIFKCFRKVLEFVRESNVQILLDDTSQAQSKAKVDRAYRNVVPQKMKDIPNDLYLLYKLDKSVMKHNSTIYGETSFDRIEYDVKFHPFYSNNMCYLQNLLTGIMGCIQDLSLNEINVHFLGHTGINLDQAYQNIEDLFIHSTKEFYNKKMKLFIDNPLLFENFIQADANFFGYELDQKTFHLYKQLQQQARNDFLDHWISYSFNKMGQQLQQSPNKNEEQQHWSPGKENSFLDRIFKEVKQIMEQLNNQQKSSMNYMLLPNPTGQPDFTTLSPKLLADAYNISLEISKNKDMTQFFEKSIAKDQNISKEDRDALEENVKIEFINKNRKLPFVLQDRENNFYSIAMEVSIDGLKNMAEEYKRQQEELLLQQQQQEFNQQAQQEILDEQVEHTESVSDNVTDEGALDTYNSFYPSSTPKKDTSHDILLNKSLSKQQSKSQQQHNQKHIGIGMNAYEQRAIEEDFQGRKQIQQKNHVFQGQGITLGGSNQLSRQYSVSVNQFQSENATIENNNSQQMPNILKFGNSEQKIVDDIEKVSLKSSISLDIKNNKICNEELNKARPINGNNEEPGIQKNINNGQQQKEKDSQSQIQDQTQIIFKAGSNNLNNI